MLHTRPMQEDDIPACVAVINEIIARGGTTAHEDKFTPDRFRTHYFQDPDIVHVVVQETRVLGFQALYATGNGRFAIGTFTDRRHPVKGAGRALFTASKTACRALGGTVIEAKITSDNASGLGYYSAMGFTDQVLLPGALTRKDGTRVDRIVKTFNLDE